jgi:retron-type reverse transcriptase
MNLLKILLFILVLPWLVMLGIAAVIVVLILVIAGLALWPFFSLYGHYRRITHGHPWHWFRARRGWGKTVEELARRLGMPADELRAFRPKYTQAFVPKRNGGQRRLSVPDAKTKALQRLLLRRLLARLRRDPCAVGFERGQSIVHNALPHVGKRVIVRLDVVDFFPATRPDRLEAYFRRIGWNAEASSLLVKLTTYKGGLPQGAPTSPRLSNLVNIQLDWQMERLAKKRKGAYTRYADDITFSFPKDYPRRVRGVIQKARRILKWHGYEMHRRRKLHIRRRHQRQMVTGLVVNWRVNLPRERRRLLRAVRHRISTGKPATMTPAQLQGWEGLQKMIVTQVSKSDSNTRSAPAGRA